MSLLPVSVSQDASSVMNGTITFVMARWSKGYEHDFFGHVMPLPPASASYDANGIINGTTAFV